jgi:enoyl-CoA hydratase/carnithine racemase
VESGEVIIMSFPEVFDSKLELQNRVATLTFQRDDVRNALTGTHLGEDIARTVKWANHSPEVSVLILTGAGKAFSAGGNVKEMQERKGLFSGSALEIQDKYRRSIQQISLAVHKAEIPVIAAVNGPAIGAGMDLACMCDFRIGSRHARLGQTFINLGIIPGAGGVWFLQRSIGYQKTAELALSGRLIEAEEALQMGIFLEIVEPEVLSSRAMEFAAQFAKKPPLTLRLIKRLLKQSERQNLEDYLDFCACFQGMSHHTEDHLEAMAAFFEKKPPRYQGK